MDALEKEQRDKVVAVAKTWLRTPYHHMGRVKGVGVDCLTLLAEVYHEAALISKVGVPYYPKDWMHHRDAERYMDGLSTYAHEVTREPLPGDIVIWKVGRCYSHGAIVVDWPTIIHAQAGCMVLLENALGAASLTHIGENTSDKGKPRLRKTFSLWG